MADSPDHFGPPTIRGGRYSRILCVCQKIHPVRSIFHRCRWTVNAKPFDGGGGRFSLHRQSSPRRPVQNRFFTPLSLESHKLTWANYGGYVFQYLSSVGGRNKLTSDQFAKDAATGKLPNVSWVYATSQFDEHPPDPGKGPMGNVTTGMQWTVDQVNAIVKGGLWGRIAIFITWDDWGRWYDHVDPPNMETWKPATPQPCYKGTQFRYGSRVPCLVLSPYAKSGYVSKILHSHVSVAKFCESLFGLRALNQRDAQADNMADCFDFQQTSAQPASPKP